MKIVKFLSITIFILVTRAYDAYCSVLYTPDLSHEANPLVTVLGINSWTLLLGIVGALTFYVIYMLYVNTFQENTFLPKEKGLGFVDFSVQTYLGRKGHWSEFFYRFPSLNRFHYIFGYMMSRSLVFAGIVSTVMWLLINYTDWYLQGYHSANMIYGIILVGMLGISIGYFRGLYGEYNLEIER